MKVASIFSALLFFATGLSYAQVPHLTGTIEVSVTNGVLDADVKLSNIPTGSQYALRLNTGFNVEYFRDSKDTVNFSFDKAHQADKSYEAWLYTLKAKSDETSSIPPQLQIKYTGKFPVRSDKTKASDRGDWKGNIAFNGKTLRATEQSAWYPVLYDTVNDLVMDKYTYDLTVRCADCKALYLNGDAPVYGTQSTFSSKEPVALLLLTGQYEFEQADGVYIINAALPQQMQTTLLSTTSRIIDYYQQKLGIPYGSPVVYLADTAVSRKDSWMFVTYPTIAFITPQPQAFAMLFDTQTFQFKETSMQVYFAHELAHYYAGTYFKPNSTLFWFWLEGLADYLSVQAARTLFGDEEYRRILTDYMQETGSVTPMVLSRIETANEIDNTYRYSYAPLLLTAIEQELGEEKMWQWLRIVLTSGSKNTDFSFFKTSLLQAGVSQVQLDHLILHYIDSPQAQHNVYQAVKAAISN